jgi:hypothetical protein
VGRLPIGDRHDADVGSPEDEAADQSAGTEHLVVGVGRDDRHAVRPTDLERP